MHLNKSKDEEFGSLINEENNKEKSLERDIFNLDKPILGEAVVTFKM